MLDQPPVLGRTDAPSGGVGVVRLTEEQKAEASHLLLGEAYFKRGVACDCADDEGCMWCCRLCNVDRHRCPACGAVSDHKNTPCPECEVR